MKNLIDPEFKFYDECETIADYIEEHIYDTIAWQLPLDTHNNFSKAMEQVVAILASRFFYNTNTNSER